MASSASTIVVKDGNGTAVSGGVRAIDESGTGSGPYLTTFTWYSSSSTVPYQSKIDYDGAVAVKAPVVEVSTTVTRPADTTQYAVGDLVANSTTAGSVTALTFANVARADQTGCRSFYIRKVRLFKSGTSTTSASFRLHLYKSSPLAPANGDNGAFSTARNGYMGGFDITVDRAFTDGAQGNGVPIVGSEVGGQLSSGTTIYGLLEARDTYTPSSGETFTIELVVWQV